MDLFDGYYYKMMKVLLCLVGRWPYQSFKQRAMMTSIVIGFWSYTLFHRMLVYSHYDNYSSRQEVILESISPLIIDVMTIAKYITTSVKLNTIIGLFECIREDWKIFSEGEEKKILEYHVNAGRVMSGGYIGALYVVAITFPTEPITEQNYYKMFENITIPKRFSIPIYWESPDIEKYYYYLVAFQTFITNMIITLTTANDAMFITFLQHVTGLFAVTGYMLKNLPIEDIDNQNQSKAMKDVAYDHYVKCMKSHKRALEFAENLESIYVWCFGIVMALNMPVMSITAMQLTTGDTNIVKSLKYGSFAGMQMIHLYFYCLLSQRLLDTSALIPECAMSGKWYLCSVKAQRLVKMIMMRSQIPCHLTAGKVLVLSMETFTSIVKTSGSYFTMLVQMQNA